MYLPKVLFHTYTIPVGARAHLLVMTFPVGDYPGGWGGYAADGEKDGEALVEA